MPIYCKNCKHKMEIVGKEKGYNIYQCEWCLAKTKEKSSLGKKTKGFQRQGKVFLAFLIVLYTLILGVSALTTADCYLGGTITIDGNYCIHTFKTNASFNITSPLTVEVLVIAGGGGGGYNAGGGGGAGGYNQTNITLTTGNKTVIIGTGGANAGGGNYASNGTNSSFDTIQVIGGGGAGSSAVNGFAGGSGGGGGGSGGTGGSSLFSQGNNAGDGAGGIGGGGGGATSIGIDGGTSGNGGAGFTTTINGTSYCFAGGGGGGAQFTAGTATCGGSDGAIGAGTASNALANTGGGGGGAGNAGGLGGNGGSGIVIVKYLAGQIVNSKPITNSNLIPQTITFVCNSTIQNISSVILNVTGTNNWTQSIIGLNTNNYNATFVNATIPLGSYTWNCIAEDLEGLNHTSVDWTFNIKTFVENSITYITPSTSGNIENFTLNFTLGSSTILNSIYFNYNNTNYPVSLTNIGNDYLAFNSLNVPAVLAVTNKTFYWILDTNAGNYNSSFNNQTINVISIDNCLVNTQKILNLTLYDEETGLIIPEGVNGNGSIEVTVNLYPLNRYAQSNYLVATYSHNFNVTNNGSICIANLTNSSYYMDTQIRYGATNYVTKLYNIQKYYLTNATALQNIPLYNLLSTSSTSFLITLKDETFNFLSNALIIIQRKDIGAGTYKTVEIPLSDTYGTATGHFSLDSVLYTINLVKNGVTLATFNDITVTCEPTLAPCTLNFNVASGSNGFADFTNLDNLNYALSFNQQTKDLTLQFNTVDGSSALLNLTAYSLDYINPKVLCTSLLTSSAGTIICTIPSTTNSSFVAKIYKDGVYIRQQIFTITAPTSESAFGNEGLVLMLILIITIPLMFITDTIGILVGLIIGFITASALMLYSGGSIIGTTASIFWLILAIGIIIFKITQRRREFG